MKMNKHNISDTPIDWLKPSIHPAYARLLCAYGLKQGLKIEALLENSGLNWDQLRQQQDFISYEQFNQIYQSAVSHCDVPCLALEIESMVQMSAHGILGHGALAAPTIGQSLALIQTALTTRIKFFELDLTSNNQQLVIGLIENIALNELGEFIYIMMLGSFLDLIEKTSAPDLSAISVHFPFAAPHYHALYHLRFPEINIVFNQPKFMITMPLSLINEPCLTSDQQTFHHAQHECTTLLMQQSNMQSLASEITKKLFEFARHTPVKFPSQQAIAEDHNMSVRTLIRKLKGENTCYQDLIDNVRKELAYWYLKHSRHSIEIIAQRLGFVDTSNFSRVFKRWHQETPSAFRQRYALGNE